MEVTRDQMRQELDDALKELNKYFPLISREILELYVARRDDELLKAERALSKAMHNMAIMRILEKYNVETLSPEQAQIVRDYYAK